MYPKNKNEIQILPSPPLKKRKNENVSDDKNNMQNHIQIVPLKSTKVPKNSDDISTTIQIVPFDPTSFSQTTKNLEAEEAQKFSAHSPKIREENSGNISTSEEKHFDENSPNSNEYDEEVTSSVHEEVKKIPQSEVKTTKIVENASNYSNNEIHGEKKQYACDLCDNTFTRQECLKSHYATIHGKLKCKMCDSNFKSKDELIGHIDLVHIHFSSFKCSLCEFCSATTKGLQSHFQTEHKSQNNMKNKVEKQESKENSQLKLSINEEKKLTSCLITPPVISKSKSSSEVTNEITKQKILEGRVDHGFLDPLDCNFGYAVFNRNATRILFDLITEEK